MADLSGFAIFFSLNCLVISNNILYYTQYITAYPSPRSLSNVKKMLNSINDLYREVKAQIAKGNGKKKILISNDDEGNGYHDLFFGISENAKELAYEDYMRPWGVSEQDLDNYVVLG